MNKKILGGTSLVLASLLAFTGCQKSSVEVTQTQEESNTEAPADTQQTVTVKENKVSGIHVTIDDSTDEKMYESFRNLAVQYVNLTNFKYVYSTTGARTERVEIVYTGNYYYENNNGVEVYYVLQSNGKWTKYYINDYGRKLYEEDAALPEIGRFPVLSYVAVYDTKAELIENSFSVYNTVPTGATASLEFSKNSDDDYVATYELFFGTSMNTTITARLTFNENGLTGTLITMVHNGSSANNTTSTYTWSDPAASDIVTDFSEYHSN